MKTTFSASLILVTALAETTTTTTTSVSNTVSNYASQVLNWFSTKTQEHLSGDPTELAFGEYDSTADKNGLNCTIALDTTALGVNFVRYGAHYHGFKGFAANSYHQIYFQIEKPVFVDDEEDRRFLQTGTTTTATTTGTTTTAATTTTTTAATTPVVTGTGDYEGMAYAFQVKTGTPLTSQMVKSSNLYGKTRLNTSTVWWNTFGGTAATDTTATSNWQVNADLTKFTPAASTTVENNFHFSAWRLASALDSLNFKIVHNQDYYGQSGHRRWAAGTAVGSVATDSNNTQLVKFTFDAASTTLLGVGTVAALAMSMF